MQNDTPNETLIQNTEPTVISPVVSVVAAPTKPPIKVEVVDENGLTPVKSKEYTKSMMISLLLVIIMFMILYVMGMGVYYNS